jgi:hypothetical protein
MMRAMIRRVACGSVLTLLAVAWTAMEQPAQGAEGVRPGRPLAAARARGGRKSLPKYYAQVVTPEQREQIAKIQEAYRPKIEELQAKMKELNAQLKAVTEERDTKIEAVLTPDQKKQIAEAAAKAKEKALEKKEKKKADADAAKPAEPKPSK